MKEKNLFPSVIAVFLLAAVFSFMPIICPKIAVQAQARVRLNTTSLQMEQGTSARLKVKGAAHKKVKWSSSNTNVALIYGKGKVIAVSEGNAVITAKCGKNILTCGVSVYTPGVTLDKTSLAIFEKEEATINAKVFPPDLIVTWESSDPSIATVSQSGVVRGVKAGNVTIYAFAGQYRASCTVTVKKKEIPITDITLNKTNLSLNAGNSEKLSATITPDNTTEDKTIKWTSDNESIATVTGDGLVKAISPGSCNIVASVGSHIAICNVTVPEESVVEKDGFDKLSDYIITNGSVNKNGQYFVKKTNDKYTYAIVKSDDNTFRLHFSYSDESTESQTVTVITVTKNNTSPVECVVVTTNSAYSAEGTIDKSSYNINDVINFVIDSSSEGQEDIEQELSNAGVRTLFKGCKGFLTQAGVSYADLGFTNLGL